MAAAHTLAHSPLVMVLSQIRFPMEVIKLKSASYVEVDTAMSSAGFPMVESDATTTLDLGGAGTLRFSGQQESRRYFSSNMSLGATVNPKFISVFCVDKGQGIPYEGHEEFINRTCDVVRALESVVGKVPVERLGYRYVDALRMDDARDVLRDLFRGVAPLIDDDAFPLSVASTTVEAFFSSSVNGVALGSELPSEGAHVFCGTVPGGTVIDPAIPPKPDSRWIVDIDAYSLEGLEFSEGTIRDKAHLLANMSRGLFYNRIVNEQFITKFDD